MTRRQSLARVAAAAAELADALAELAENEGAPAASLPQRRRRVPDVAVTDVDVALARRAARKLGLTG